MHHINRIKIETTDANSDLCKLGADFGTDKSPYNTAAFHRHPYTAVYDLLFSNLRHSKLRLGEVGILDNASMKMWRSYFTQASLYGFEFFQDRIDLATKDNLSGVKYLHADVTDTASLKSAFFKAGGSFDILIDDSTHQFNDQINFIEAALEFINPGGLLVVEDIFNGWDEQKYEEKLREFDALIESATFLIPDHKLKFSEGMPEPYFDNDKILVIRRNMTRFRDFRHASSGLTRAANLQVCSSGSLAAYVVTHKPIVLPEEQAFAVIQAGSFSNPIPNILHDNTEDNISTANAFYSELTAHYWIWKNRHCEYIALFHYRRFLSAKYESFNYLGHDVASAGDILKDLQVADIVTAQPMVFYHFGTSIPETIEQHYVRHHGFELLLARDALERLFPEYISAFDAVMRNNQLLANNLMAMKKTLFDQYCLWLFTVLFEVEQKLDYSKYGHGYPARVMAFLSERLFTVWVMYNRPWLGISYRNMLLLDNA